MKIKRVNEGPQTYCISINFNDALGCSSQSNIKAPRNRRQGVHFGTGVTSCLQSREQAAFLSSEES